MLRWSGIGWFGIGEGEIMDWRVRGMAYRGNGRDFKCE